MQREGMQQYYGEVRAYFAPVDRAAETGTMFDPAASFSLDAPPAPWLPLGRVRNFKRAAKHTVGALRTGVQGVAQTQFRTQVDARVSFDFCEWGKLQMALAAGSQHMNVLEASGTTPRASGGAAKAAVAVGAGSTASQIALDTATLANYAAGQLVVVDVDYASGMAVPGSGAAVSALDADALRRMSLNVAAVARVTATSLLLDTPLPGGAPAGGAKAQKVVAFVDREGASYQQEWSAVFALEAANGGQVFFYYPRLQAAAPAEETAESRAAQVNLLALHAEFAALAAVDANDGESVVCYRTLVPAANTPAY